MEYSRIQVLFTQSRFAEAETLIRQELAKDIEDSPLYCLLSTALNRQGKNKEAVQVAREAVRLMPDSDHSHFVLASALADRKDLRAALLSVEEAVRLDPDDAENYALHAQILIAMMKWKPALEVVERGLQIDPDNESCRFHRSILLGTQGRVQEANEQSLDFLREEPDGDIHHCARGWVLYHAGDGLGAERHFIEALRIDPSSEDARDGLAEALKIQNPIVGWMFQGLHWVGRISIWPILMGLFLVGRLFNTMRSHDFAMIQLGGVVLHVLFYAFLIAILIASALSDLTLFASSRGRMALTDLKKRGICWSLIPLSLGCGHFAWWMLFPHRIGPIHAMGWCALAALLHETYDYRQIWVRQRMFVVAGFMLATMIYVEYSTAMKVRPMQLDLRSSLVDVAGKVIPIEELPAETQTRLSAFSKTRKLGIVYPALAVLLIGCFREDIADWFVRRTSPKFGFRTFVLVEVKRVEQLSPLFGWRSRRRVPNHWDNCSTMRIASERKETSRSGMLATSLHAIRL